MNFIYIFLTTFAAVPLRQLNNQPWTTMAVTLWLKRRLGYRGWGFRGWCTSPRHLAAAVTELSDFWRLTASASVSLSSSGHHGTCWTFFGPGLFLDLDVFGPIRSKNGQSEALGGVVYRLLAHPQCQLLLWTRWSCGYRRGERYAQRRSHSSFQCAFTR